MRRRVLVVLVIAMAVLASGCGGDDKKDSASNDKVQAGDSSSGTDSADGGGADDGGTDGGVTNGAAALFSSAECIQAAQAMAAAASAAGLAVSGQTEQIEKNSREFAALAAKAPSEIRDDIETFASAYNKYGQIISESGWNPASGSPPPQSVLDALAKASEELQTSDVQDAQKRLEAWFKDECPS